MTAATLPDDLATAAREAGRYYIARRQRVAGACAICGAPFVGYGGKRARLYCSTNCKTKAFRQKRRNAEKR